jgi:hypothetical protein
MNISSIRAIAPKALAVTALVGGGALALSACGGPSGRRPDDIANDLLYQYDAGKTGADQTKDGVNSLVLDSEHRKIESRKQIQDSGYYSDNYKKFDEVSDISDLLQAADTNHSGDASATELTTEIAKFDKNSDGVLDRMEEADYEIAYAPKTTEVNVHYDRDLNGRGQDAVADGIGDVLGAMLGDGN